MNPKFYDNAPPYAQIANHIINVIASGEIKPGSRMLSVRRLASGFGVNPNTAQRAMKELERAGCLRSGGTSGRFVTGDENIIRELKKTAGEELARKFVSDMTSLGESKEQIYALLDKFF